MYAQRNTFVTASVPLLQPWSHDFHSHFSSNSQQHARDACTSYIVTLSSHGFHSYNARIHFANMCHWCRCWKDLGILLSSILEILISHYLALTLLSFQGDLPNRIIECRKEMFVPRVSWSAEANFRVYRMIIWLKQMVLHIYTSLPLGARNSNTINVERWKQ
jgi:hypothetical protein